MTAFSPLSGIIAERIDCIRQALPASVRLIAVTKQVPVEAMREAYAAGVRDFAENRVQEAEAKQAKLSDLTDVTWHLIGHLQSNKAQKALDSFQWIHSIDDLKAGATTRPFGSTAIPKTTITASGEVVARSSKTWLVSSRSFT